MTSKFSIDNRELLQRISSGEAVVGIDFGNLIVRELAAFRLSAMDSEPVAWIAQNKNTGEVEIDEPFAKATNPKYWTDSFPVYRHAQPAPQLKPVGYLFVSGQGAIAYSPTDYGMPGFKLAGQIFGDIDVELKPAPVVPEGYKLVPTELTSEMVKAFRSFCEAYDVDLIAGYKAMLAAAPQSPGGDHATVPDKWIPVSERMPEDRAQVILWDAEIGEVTSGHYSHKTQTFYHCGDAIENEITHWMPPPCAPQEVK
ncbi:DUF551 domain-containing protein [Klebsiella quasipneumoniae]|nr:DUF551 domain-containing protein [Klebsiella quasipneumoniae]HBW1035087.1 DUF551 domain-containing protein [Klebsiella pneumoniae]MBK2543149.1 DUF551 domain-containing protein [Klebsiella quasipneumoniae]MBK2627291.1 DUF551 domain-containing protein [Klebsiella quasipneumoniae]MBK3028965.1 DUF551 domain-containing protein [Klebsiella quasipneumoniae]SXD20407.1 Eaa1 [Klebsiella quasipneumoniae]